MYCLHCKYTTKLRNDKEINAFFASYKGVQLSPLGFAACQSKNCTNKANSANYRRVWHPAIPTQPPNYLPTEATEPTEVSDARYSPTDCTDVQRLGGYGIPAIPTQTPNYLPTEPTEVSDARYSPTDCTDVHRLGGYGIPAIPTQTPNYLPTEPTEPTEVSDARYSPTDCTDTHRLGGYGILPYPRRHQTIFPQKPTQPNHLCASVRICGRLFYARSFCVFREFRGRTLRSQTICGHLCASVGGSSLPEVSVNSVNSVGEPYAA